MKDTIEYMNAEAGEGINFAGEQQLTKQARDITPISDQSLERISELLHVTGRTEAVLLEAIPRFLNRAVEAVPDLTEDEAIKVINFLEKRYQQMQKGAAA